ncbi:hypothetical protein CVT24_001728 [Panaeolus cyanescens]|uniref:Uncharacterized protein n=1 Tax=Panaeolus cyanescens TaxID=181874 RepID=A0A409YFQ6_9AGAR|nr:hypothetical protein CVT24_001728 [Panaeolus cyanescens]
MMRHPKPMLSPTEPGMDPTNGNFRDQLDLSCSFRLAFVASVETFAQYRSGFNPLPTPPCTSADKENEAEAYRARLRSSTRQSNVLQAPGSPRRRRRVSTAAHMSVFHARGDMRNSRSNKGSRLLSNDMASREPLVEMTSNAERIDAQGVLATPPPTEPVSLSPTTSVFSIHEDAVEHSAQAHSRPNNRAIAQRERRRREREQRERFQQENRAQRELRYVWMGDVDPDHIERGERASAVDVDEDRGDEMGVEETDVENMGPALRPAAIDIPLARRPYREPTARHYLGRMNHTCRSCGALHWLDEKLASSSSSSPVFTTCCDHGTVDIPLLQPPPEPLFGFFTNEHDAQSKNFRDHIAEYNRALAFTSLGVSEDHSVNAGRGQPVFRIHGELCHRTGSLLPPPQRQPIYAQLYFYDPRSSLDLRMQNNAGSQLREDTMAALQRIIYDHHQYAPLYLHAYEILRDYSDADDVSIRLRVVPGTVRSQQEPLQLQGDIRTYRPPTADDVCLIYPEDPTAEWRDIILRRRSGRLERISECHPAYAPLQYPNDTLKIPQRMLSPDEDHLIKFIYPDLQYHAESTERASSYFKDRMILSPRNVDVWQLNEKILQKINTPSRTYLSADTLVDDEGS